MPLNAAIPFPTFQRAMRIIQSITLGSSTIIVTTFAHQYKSGCIVRLYIPADYGAQQLNQQFGPITVIDAVTFSLPIDSTNFDPYNAAPILPHDNPQVVPIAEINSILSEATQNVLPY
jgi:hypothetical protein